MLVIGAAGFTFPRDAAALPFVKRIDAVDVDPVVLDIAERHFLLQHCRRKCDSFRFPRASRLHKLRRAGEHYGFTFLDAYSGKGIPDELLTVEFFSDVRAVSERVAANVIMDQDVESAFARNVLASFRQAFGRVWVKHVRPEDEDLTNIMVTNMDMAGSVEWTGAGSLYTDNRNTADRDHVELVWSSENEALVDGHLNAHKRTGDDLCARNLLLAVAASGSPVACLRAGAATRANRRWRQQRRWKVHVEVVVDGAADVEIRGDTANLRDVSGQPPQFRRFECTGVLPPNPVDFRFRGIDGRGRQTLIRDATQGGSAVVRIEDPEAVRKGTRSKSSGATGAVTAFPGQGRFGERERRMEAFDAWRVVRECQEAVRREAAERYRASNVEFREARVDDDHDFVGSGACRPWRRSHGPVPVCVFAESGKRPGPVGSHGSRWPAET